MDIYKQTFKKSAVLKKIDNIYCTRLDAYWAFQLLFKDRSVKKIIMNYPDPWFKKISCRKKAYKERKSLCLCKKN